MWGRFSPCCGRCHNPLDSPSPCRQQSGSCPRRQRGSDCPRAAARPSLPSRWEESITSQVFLQVEKAFLTSRISSLCSLRTWKVRNLWTGNIEFELDRAVQYYNLVCHPLDKHLQIIRNNHNFYHTIIVVYKMIKFTVGGGFTYRKVNALKLSVCSR